MCLHMKNNINELVKRSGKTFQQVADEAGMTRGYLNELKAGKKRLNSDVLESLAKVLGCTPADIIAESLDKPSDKQINQVLLASCLSAVMLASEKMNIKLRREKMIATAVKLYTQSQRFDEEPTQSTAYAILELMQRSDDGREMETPPPGDD